MVDWLIDWLFWGIYEWFCVAATLLLLFSSDMSIFEDIHGRIYSHTFFLAHFLDLEFSGTCLASSSQCSGPKPLPSRPRSAASAPLQRSGRTLPGAVVCLVRVSQRSRPSVGAHRHSGRRHSASSSSPSSPTTPLPRRDRRVSARPRLVPLEEASKRSSRLRAAECSGARDCLARRRSSRYRRRLASSSSSRRPRDYSARPLLWAHPVWIFSFFKNMAHIHLFELGLCFTLKKAVDVFWDNIEVEKLSPINQSIDRSQRWSISNRCTKLRARLWNSNTLDNAINQSINREKVCYIRPTKLHQEKTLRVHWEKNAATGSINQSTIEALESMLNKNVLNQSINQPTIIQWTNSGSSVKFK